MDLRNRIYGDFEIPKIKIDGIKSMGKDLAEQVAENIIGGKVSLELEKIAKDIVERQDNAKAMEFTKAIGTLLRENGVTPIMTEYNASVDRGNSLEMRYGYAFESLDFSEHDKVFEDKIEELKRKNKNLVNTLNETQIEKAYIDCDLYNAKQRIAELERKENDKFIMEVKVPATPTQIATHLINNTCTINELEQIAEHLLVYCKHNRESE